ncbi:hypothetical protein QE152_g31140 [Popillia japonica]|uniref:Uncharacterized protein n=1 Tax=Popillia japonica TaxID=7064 RepID=A0AAW1JCA8_POPJA
MARKYLSDREIEQLFETSEFFDSDNSDNGFHWNAGERDLNFVTSEAEDNVEIVEDVADDITGEIDEDDNPLIRFVQQGPSNIYTSKSGFAWNASVPRLADEIMEGEAEDITYEMAIDSEDGGDSDADDYFPETHPSNNSSKGSHSPFENAANK